MGVSMTGRRLGRRPADAASSLESLAALMRTWQEHWDEVGAIQRSLPRAARDRVASLSSDVETALAQTRHVFALEFAPEAVAALRSRIDEALAVLDEIATATVGTASRPVARRTAARLAASQLAVNVRDVVAAGEMLEMHLQPIVAL